MGPVETGDSEIREKTGRKIGGYDALVAQDPMASARRKLLRFLSRACCVSSVSRLFSFLFFATLFPPYFMCFFLSFYGSFCALCLSALFFFAREFARLWSCDAAVLFVHYVALAFLLGQVSWRVPGGRPGRIRCPVSRRRELYDRIRRGESSRPLKKCARKRRWTTTGKVALNACARIFGVHVARANFWRSS